MSTPGKKFSSVGLGTSRIEAFSDGVFAIVITLLILQFGIPNLPRDVAAAELSRYMWSLWPKLVSYVVSFAVVGIYWVAHHNIFHYIKRSDRVLLWLNLLFLMCVAFIPFPTALMGTYGAHRISIITYGANLIVVGLSLHLLWWYATYRHHLVEPDLDPALIGLAKRRILTAPLVYAVAIALSFVRVELSLPFYLLVPVLYILPGKIDRHWHRHHPEQA